jgi:molybdate transport system permease protein
LPLAVLMAWALVRTSFPGRGLVNALVHLPLVLPPVVTGWLLLIVFGIRGPVGSLLNDWFGIRLVFTTAGAALACAVMTFPVMVRSIRLSLEAADPGLEQAARTLGAGRLDRLLTVTLPLASPGILVGGVVASPSPPTSPARRRRCRWRSMPPCRCRAARRRRRSCRWCR